jgi:hypothetical protein
MTLTDFLEKFLDGYLLEDLCSMEGYQLAADRKAGALGYPIVMTVCSGIEMLGTLSFDASRVSKDDGQQYFRYFWRTWMYPNDQSRQKLDDPMYRLVRHGIAHIFQAKPRIIVTRLSDPAAFHL